MVGVIRIFVFDFAIAQHGTQIVGQHVVWISIQQHRDFNQAHFTPLTKGTDNYPDIVRAISSAK